MLFKRIMFTSVLTSACIWGLAAPAAIAQTSTSSSSADSSSTSSSSARSARDTGIPTIVVTAQKRSQSVEDVPVAVSAYTAETRQILGLESLQDYANFTPGLSYSPSNDRVFVRGVGRQTNTNGSDPGVATYADGVYNASTVAVSGSDFFLQRVEILRGAQGTLYGRNSIGGAINAISKRPTQDFESDLRFTAGNYGRTDYAGSVSGSVTSWLRARLAGSYNRQRDGYFKNIAGGPSEGDAGNQRYFELQLDADVTSNLNAWLKVSSASQEMRPLSTNLVDPYRNAPYPKGYIAPGAGFGYTTGNYTEEGTVTHNPGQFDHRDVSHNTISNQHLHDNIGIATHVTWELPNIEIKYIGGYQKYKLDQRTEIDNTSVTSYVFPLAPFSTCSFVPGCTADTIYPSQQFLYVQNAQFSSHELDISSTGSSPIQWITGLYYYGENAHQASHFNAPDQPQLRAPANGPANPGGDFVTALSTLHTRSIAGFGQVDWSVSDAIKLTAGLRYTYDARDGDEALRVVCYGCGGFTPDIYGTLTPALDVTSASASFTPAPGVVAPATTDPATGFVTRDLKASWNALTGTLGIEWRPDDETLTYARYNRGYKSGGFNAGGVSATPETDPEFINDYELGYKRTFGSSFQLNAAAYYYDYKGLQVPLTVPTPSGANLTRFFNLDSSHSYGVELSTIWQPIEHLKMMLNYGYGASRIEKACCFVDGTDTTASQPGAKPVGPAVGGQQSQSLVGNELPQTPRNKVAFNAVYTFVFDPGQLDVSGSYTWRDSSYSLVFNRDYNKIPSYDQVDLRLIWTQVNDRYRIIAFVKNAFDTTGYDGATGGAYLSSSFPPNSVAQTYSYTPPRTFGVQMQYHFR